MSGSFTLDLNQLLSEKHLNCCCTFFMNKLSCLEHLSTLSLSSEMSEMMLRRESAQRLTHYKQSPYNTDKTTTFPQSPPPSPPPHT